MKNDVKADYIIAGCDLHEQNMLVKIAADKEEPVGVGYGNCPGGHFALMADLRRRSAKHGGAEVVFAYEASSMGYALYDKLVEAGITCHVLAPIKMEQSPHSRRRKTDEADAQRIFELLRAHLLAGNKLPTCYVPDKQVRDDREMTRTRDDLSRKLSKARTQVTSLLKSWGVAEPKELGKRWTKGHEAWLKTVPEKRLSYGASRRLASLLRQIKFFKEELKWAEAELEALAQAEHNKAAADALTAEKGVGTVVAMTFLAELGDLKRFPRGSKVAAYLGLVPSSHESGKANDRKGHITKQGPSRVRAVLCQAAWSFVRHVPWARAKYKRLVARNPKKKNIALVAIMHDLAIHLWRKALAAQTAAAEAPGG